MSIRPQGTYYRPKVVYNKATRRHVLWVNVLPRPGSPAPPPDFTKSSYLVASSSTGPAGPYQIVEVNATMRYGEGGDFSLFIDDDSATTGYVIYTSLSEAHSISVAPLNANYTASIVAHNSPFLPGTDHTGCFEGPALFKRTGVYYATLGPCSCFGRQGSETWLYTATSPLGPFTRAGSLGNAEQAQQNYVFQAPLASGDTAYVWTGDRWKSTPDGEKAHDFQFWQPLNFTKVDPRRNVTGFFAICPKCHPSDPVYWVDDETTLHHVPRCNLCGQNLCDQARDIDPSFISGHPLSADFDCGMLLSQPIAPLSSVSALPNFTLDVADALAPAQAQAHAP